EIGSETCVLGATLSWSCRKARSAYWRSLGAAESRPAPRIAAAAILAAIIASAPTIAKDRETVAMAFTCAVVEGKARLNESTKRRYQIIGGRKEQTLRVCNGNAGARCRNLRVHKFQF